MRGLKNFDPERFRGRYRKGGFSARAPKTSRRGDCTPDRDFGSKGTRDESQKDEVGNHFISLKSRSKPAYRLNIIAVYGL
jgi:hypothetical protein